jgi:crotonobetainyl-CoA:carnitine CoA-transferase CaiB-like acyl-CoA transferase
MEVLENTRVLTLATNLPGPLAVARLRSMGARVRKIEPPTGDLLERARPEWYRTLHEGIDVERQDLKGSAGRARLEAVLQETDLLVTASRPSSLARLGLGWDDLHARLPLLSHLAIVGNPAPEEELPGHDLLYQAGQGLVLPPELPRTCLADLGGALEAVIAALQLVLARRAGEPGRRWPVSLAESASWFAEPLRRGLTAPGGMLGGGFGGYRIYLTKQGWIAVAALEPQFQKALADETGVSDLDPAALQELFLTRTAAEWVRVAREKDLPLAEVGA